MKAAETSGEQILEADIAVSIAVLKAQESLPRSSRTSWPPALRSSIQFTNRIKGHSASIPDHAAVAHAIMKRQPDKARAAMKKLVSDVLDLIDTVEHGILKKRQGGEAPLETPDEAFRGLV